MYSTGPLFLSVIWQEYKKGRGRNVAELGAQVGNVVGGGADVAKGLGRWDGSEAGRVRVLMADEYNQKPWAFFKWHGGSSWHGKDARLIFWMGRHWMLLTVTGFLLAGFIGLCMWWIYRRMLLLGERRRKGAQVASVEIIFGKAGRIVQKIPFPFFRTRNPKDRYELLEDRHNV